MSGTSCDGLDVVLLHVGGNGKQVALKEFRTIEYPSSWADRLGALCRMQPAEALQLEVDWTLWASGRIAGCLAEWQSAYGPVHLIGLSGHTWYHEPGGRGTKAIGDGAALHRNLGIPVVADYRSADVAAGGQGAPLVPLFDAEVFPHHGACLNLGGIANITLLPGLSGGPVRASDLCGANLLLNRQARRSGLTIDRNGDLARSGRVHVEAMAELGQWPFLERPWPKSLAAEDLEYLHRVLDDIGNPSDASATAVEWLSAIIGRSLPMENGSERTLMVTGGGAHHDFLIERLRGAVTPGWRVILPDPHWIDGKEAAAFAWLALRTAEGKSTSLSSVTGASHDVHGGALFGTFAQP